MNKLAQLSKIRVVASLLVTAAALGACSRGNSTANQQSANGAIDTTSTDLASVQAEGPGVQVTRTDSKSVTRSTRYELTPDNFAHFMAAADSLSALAQRDSAVRAYLTQDITDAGAKTMDAGRAWLDANPAVSAAINNAGISTEDYYVQSLAIAAAERYINDPKAAPPTPTLKKNAEFLRSHQADLSLLQSLRLGKPLVVVKP